MIRKILIIQTAFIGDVILTIPMVKVLKEHFKDSEIDFLCIPKTKELLENNSNISDIIVYDKHNELGMKGLKGIYTILKKKNYDVIVSPHRSFRSSFLAFFSGSKLTIGFNTASLSILYKKTVNYIKNIHEIQRNLKLLEPLGIVKNSIINPEFFITAEIVSKIDKLLFEYNIAKNNNFILAAPGSIWFTKRFPYKKFSKVFNLLKQLDLGILLIGSGDDVDLCDKIISESENKNLINLAGKISLLETVEIIRRSRLLLTNDSAPLHMANAVGTKVIALFGATIPEFGFYPYGEKDGIFEINGLKCRPCGIHGGNKCPIKTFDCMNKLSEKEIAKTILNSLF
jgi:heptosyltransferase II